MELIEKLDKLYYDCIDELKSIGIDITNKKNIGDIDIKIARRSSKRYGCCKHENPNKRFVHYEKHGWHRKKVCDKYETHHIEISKWVMQLDDKIIKNTIIHEMLHCLPYCNNHGTEFKKYAKYINDKLGYNIKRLGDREKDYKESNIEYKKDEIKYKYKIRCKNCGQVIYRQRFNIKQLWKFRCGKCSGRLELLETMN